jgi:hypothetical protein
MKRVLVLLFMLMLLPAAWGAGPGDEDVYELLPVDYLDDKPFYIDYGLFFRENMPGFEDGKNFVKFDDEYGAEQEMVWRWFSGGVKEVRLYSLEGTDDWDNAALGALLFSAALGPNDVLDFRTQIPEGAPPRVAVLFATTGADRVYALGYNGRTGAVNPIQIEPR